MTPIRVAGALAVVLAAPWLGVPAAHAESFAQLPAVPVVVSPTCGGTVSAEAQVTPVQVIDRLEGGVRVAIHYDAGSYDGSCALTVTADWTNLDTGASGSGGSYIRRTCTRCCSGIAPHGFACPVGERSVVRLGRAA